MADAQSFASHRDVLDIQPRDVNYDTPEQRGLHAVHPKSPSGEEQALESHEVIELQSFSERKAWIEEKIKFLEALPPIEVFIGLDSIRSGAEDVPGLPTRLQLEQWMAEHDVIEKETEIFDTGELKKLRQLTKAATQRNLSPEDTDVIELTLTTIYALDKLLHLLRDRSENLEMMSIRLSWEENRRTAWAEQRRIIEDLNTFAASRARWNTATYEQSTPFEESNALLRRGSIASQGSASSDNLISSPAFSRSTRFRLAEMLSRDAAQFTGRVTSLRHGKVTAAGKALDKLIDQSRKPVPDELLDEQDRLEEKCINEMENFSKFAMNLVMQWRKADEVYVETRKDDVAASNLLEEIETAKLYHPTARQSASFLSRADTIFKRLAIRGDPSSSSSLFPRPEHVLFPDQKSANESLVKTLSDSIIAANKLSMSVNSAAKEYKNSYEAVRQVETLLQDAGQIITDLLIIVNKFEEGIPSEEGDGSPPNLMSELCLDPSRHALFIALFPSLLDEAGKATAAADQQLRTGPALFMALDIPGIDDKFKENAASEMKKLSSLRNRVVGLLDTSTKQLTLLRDSRKIASNINSASALLKTIKLQMVDFMERDRWRQQFGNMDAPPTPESPTSELPLPPTKCSEFEEQLSQISTSAKVNITEPLQQLSANLESGLYAYLLERAAALQRSLEDGNRLSRLLGSIREQYSAMVTIRDDFHGIMTHIEDAKIQVTNMIEEVLELKPEEDAFISKTSSQDTLDIGSKYLGPIQSQAAAFVDSISNRVPFVAQHSTSSTGRMSSLKSPSSSGDFHTRGSDDTAVIPFDLTSLDSIVRGDSNSYALRTNGSVETLVQLNGYFDAAVMAREVDLVILTIAADVDRVAQALLEQKASFTNLPQQADDTLQHLQGMLNSLGMIRLQHANTTLSISSTHVSMQTLDERSKSLGTSIRERIYKARSESLHAIEAQSKKLEHDTTELHSAIEQAIELEHRYRDELEATRVFQIKEQEERLAAEEAVRVQMELARAEEVERQRLLEKQLVEEREQEATRQRELIELAEKQRVEREATEAEERRIRDVEQRAEAARLVKAEEQRAQEEAEKARLEQERRDVLQKLRSIEAQLQEERRLHAERELSAANLATSQRDKMEELTRRQAEMELLAEKSAHLAEMERTGKQRIQKEVKEHEEYLMRRYSELQQLLEDQARQAELERAEKKRLEQEAKGYAEALTERHMKDMLLAEESAKQLELARAERERAEMEARKLAQELEEQRAAQLSGSKEQDMPPMRVEEHLARNDEDVQDVFGIVQPQAISGSSNSEDLVHLQTQVLAMRKRLRSIRIHEALSPPKGSTQLPTEEHFQTMQDELGAVAADVQMLPIDTDNANLNVELKALRDEVRQSESSLRKVYGLVDMSTAINQCDAALSDLLEHVDSYPSAPLLMLSTFRSAPTTSPEGQLTARLTFTENIVRSMDSKFGIVSNDHRAKSEHSRINQTWNELHEMASDRINGKKSRPSSVVSRNSSGRNSSISNTAGPSSQPRAAKKVGSYSHLSVASVSSTSKGQMLAPPVPPLKARRAVSNTSESNTRSTSRSSSISTARSVSGPIKKVAVKPSEVAGRSSSRLSSTSTVRSASGPFSGSLSGTTFASRQRTISLSNNVSTPPPRLSLTASRSRLNSETKRGISPAISETSSYSHSHSSVGPRPSLNASTWSRAPRDSLSSLLPPRVATPHKKAAPPVRKKYVADPKNKLDVAVGDVVNQLEVGINIESISESWRDQSGKYWIGNQDPKLCFCRILRSQTVMVRVGGGWTELSKFIKDHFADSFRIASDPESPPRPNAERWISSATLLESRQSLSPPRAPQTPEPTTSFVPSFALVTPSGQSPKSIKSLSPQSLRTSPLMPLQFMRRAEPGPDLALLRPATPTKTPLRSRLSTSTTPSRNSVWRP